MALERITQTGRITSLHGTYLPPKKKERALKHLTISFIILGTIPSKKNLAWAASNWHFVKNKLYGLKTPTECVDFLSGQHGLKVFIQNSKKYTDWVGEQTPVIKDQANVWADKFMKYGLKFPLDNVSMKVYHYWKDDIERDLTNKYDTIADLMVSCGIIENDSWQVLKRIHSEGENYKNQIVQAITRVDITQSFFEHKISSSIAYNSDKILC